MATPLYPAEALSIRATDYATRITFKLAGEAEGGDLCVVSLPHPVAKQLAMMLRAQLLQVERMTNRLIWVHPDALKGMKVSPEDWPQLPLSPP